MLELLFIRHGQTDWNRDRKIMGDEPIGLNETGKEQARLLAKKLLPLDFLKIYSSPLVRTLETAKILSEAKRLPIEQELNLREIDYGEWAGRTFQEVRSTPGFEAYYKNPHRPVGNTGESLVELHQRVLHFFEKLREEKRPGKIAVVTHADWIKCAVLNILKLPLNQLYQLRIDNASVTYITLEGKWERVIGVNHTLDFESSFVSRGPL